MATTQTNQTQSNKTALITGASSGIGKELAQIHAARGGNLVVVARSEQKLNQLKSELEREYGSTVMVIVQDLTQPDAPQNVFDTVTNAGVQVDYLINNAGFGGHGLFHEREWESDLSMIQLNVVALTHLSRLFLPAMVQRNSGRILNVSSTASFTPGPLQAVYFATKSYVTFLSNAIAEELVDTHVTVTALMPGATETGFAKTSGMDKTDLFADVASAAEVAKAGYEAMLAGKLDVVAGITFVQKLMLAAMPFTPKKVLLKQIKKMQEVK